MADLLTSVNQMHSQLEDLQSMYDKETEENKRLVADCDKYQDRFCDMESQMTSLKMELQSMVRARSHDFQPIHICMLCIPV